MNSTIERTYCERCGTWRFKPVGALCFHCSRGQGEAALSLIQCISDPITFANVTVDAPGFDADTFTRALMRALVDDIEIVTDATGEAIAQHAGRNGGYPVSRHSCQCPAGVHNRPCKHRALYCLTLDVIEPQRRKQWAAAARKLVAA